MGTSVPHLALRSQVSEARRRSPTQPLYSGAADSAVENPGDGGYRDGDDEGVDDAHCATCAGRMAKRLKPMQTLCISTPFCMNVRTGRGASAA